jgi:2,3-bisphosphoglycerate-independent phosphoglycerate mutase
MDRDKRWERVRIAVDALTKGEGWLHVMHWGLAQLNLPLGESIESSEKLIATIEERYKKDETDEFLKPIVVGDSGRIKGA